MNLTVVIILAVVALTTLGYGMYLSRTPAFPDLLEKPLRPGLPYRYSNGRLCRCRECRAALLLNRPPNPKLDIVYNHLGKKPRLDPPQSVSGIIPFGQAAGDYPDPEAAYEKLELAPPDWRKEP